MTLRRFYLTLGLVALMQSGVFAWVYSDLLYLRQPESIIANSSRDDFARNAESALARTSLTRRHLDTIADVARKFGQSEYEVQALRRRVKLDLHDRTLRLELADALRRNGDVAESEAIYRDALRASVSEAR